MNVRQLIHYWRKSILSEWTARETRLPMLPEYYNLPSNAVLDLTHCSIFIIQSCINVGRVVPAAGTVVCAGTDDWLLLGDGVCRAGRGRQFSHDPDLRRIPRYCRRTCFDSKLQAPVKTLKTRKT